MSSASMPSTVPLASASAADEAARRAADFGASSVCACARGIATAEDSAVAMAGNAFVQRCLRVVVFPHTRRFIDARLSNQHGARAAQGSTLLSVRGPL